MDKMNVEVSFKEVEEFHRIGKYEKDKSRPLKIAFQSKQTAEEVLKAARNLKDREEFKMVAQRRNLSNEDREILKQKVDEAKKNNNERSVEEINNFVYKIV